jgi:hypothetical protein
MDLSQLPEPPSLTEVLDIKREIAAEVAHLPIDEALRELARRARGTREELPDNNPLPADGTHG